MFHRAVAGALVVLALAAVGGAQTTKPAFPDTVIDIRVEGNKALSANAVLANVLLRVGGPYSESVVREDEQRLLKTRRFVNVTSEQTQTDKGIIVTFKVTERPLISAVTLDGVKGLKLKDVQELISFSAGDAIDQFRINNAAKAIENKYQSEGYYFVKVTYDAKALAEKGVVAYVVVEGPEVFIRKVSYEGNASYSPDRLGGLIGGVVKTRTRFWPIFTGNLDTDQIERDVVDLANFYRDEGFLDVQVDSRIAITPDKKSAEVTFIINEGLRYRIRNITFDFSGNRVFSDATIRKEMKSAPGGFFNGLTLRRDTETIRKLYGEIGFTDMNVSSTTPYTNKEGEIDLAFRVTAGDQYRAGRIDIRGNSRTKDKVIRRQVQFFPGQWYDTVAAEETQKRLKESSLFDAVTVTPYADAAPGVKNASVNVTEGRTAQFGIGVGVSSNSGLLGSISYTERNADLYHWPNSEDWANDRAFRGDGQIFSISAEPGTELMRFRVDWTDPYWLDKPLVFGLRGYAFQAVRETYDENRFGVMGSLGHRFKNRWYGEVAERVELVNIDNLTDHAPEDVIDVEGNSFLSGTKGTLVRDNTDSRWLPTKGDRLAVSYEQVTGSYLFGKINGDYHAYWSPYRDALDRPHVLAGRASVGDIVGDAPTFERYYGGGLGSLRGFKYRGVSPRQGEHNEPVGGDFMLFLGTEYSFPLVGEFLRGVAFVDTGTVEQDVGVTNYRASVGFGIRLHLPFFGPVPMSLDFGVPLAKDPQDDTQIVSFSIGWVF